VFKKPLRRNRYKIRPLLQSCRIGCHWWTILNWVAIARCPINTSQICPYRGNNGKRRRSLSQKYAYRDSKF
jgi:hypothetical protein